jgi:hypothetical protein
MRIQVLGTGCYKCIQLQSLIHEVVRELGRTDVEVLRIDDERTIRKFMPPDAIPGLVIDGRLVVSGRIPDRATLRAWLRTGEMVE